MELEIRTIDYGSEDYIKSLDLRNKVLRMPLGMNLFDENLDRDSTEMHAGAFDGNNLIGILILSGVGGETVQMRQVAVEEAYRKRGVGTRLVEYSEGLARENGYSKIILHARETAVAFYEKLGYIVRGEPFIEVGIPHREMAKYIL